jgi:hypothetical protein
MKGFLFFAGFTDSRKDWNLKGYTFGVLNKNNHGKICNHSEN